MAKYAPANEAGDKPYVVEYYNWGRSKSKVVYAKDAPAARYAVIGRDRSSYATRIRRALSHEVPAT